MRIFITYSHEDRVNVEHLVQDIYDLGHNVWYDQQLTGGHVWWDEVIEQIVNAELIIIALSPSWLQTHSCQLELAYAQSLNKRILPIEIVRTEYEVLPIEFQRVKLIDYTEEARKQPARIAYAIQHLPTEPPLPNPLPAPPEAPLSELARLQQQVRAPRLTFDAQKSLVNHIRWHLYSPDLREVHQARRLLQELSERQDVAVMVKSYVDDIINTSDDIDTDRLQPESIISDEREETNPKPFGIGISEQRRLDIAMPSEAVIGQPTQLWVQLCLTSSAGFRNELAALMHSGISPQPEAENAAKPQGSKRPRRTTNVQFEITGMGFKIEDAIQEILVPSDQDAGLLTITLLPDTVTTTGFVRVTAKRLITTNKYVTLGSVAVSVHVHDQSTAAYASKKWVLRNLTFAASVLFDDAVQSWGTQQARLQTPPTPWTQPQAPAFPDRIPQPPHIRQAAPVPRPIPMSSYFEQTLPSSAAQPTLESEPVSTLFMPPLWLLGSGLALIIAVVVGGLIALFGAGNNTPSVASSEQTPTHTAFVSQIGASSTDTPEIPTSASPTEVVPTATETFLIPTQTSDSSRPVQPSPTPIPQIRLRYTIDRFTLENITGDNLDITPLVFVGEQSLFVANEWQFYVEETTTSTLEAFPSRGCVHVIVLGGEIPNSSNVVGCVRVNAYVAEGNQGQIFWQSESGNILIVRWNGETIAQCPPFNPTNITSAELTCEFSLP